MFNKLEELIKKCEGNVLSVCLDDKLINLLNNNNKLYIYANKEIDKDLLIKNYKRYNVKIEYSEYKTGYILIIDNTKSKNKFIMDKLYFIKDTFYNITEFIGNLLVN